MASRATLKSLWSWLGPRAGVAGCALLGVLLLLPGLDDLTSNPSYDWQYWGRPARPANEAVIIYLDDESHAALEQKYRQPWDRALHARLVNRLSAAGAKVVVFDIVFDEEGTSPAQDLALAAAFKRNGKTVLCAIKEEIGSRDAKARVNASMMKSLLPELEQSARAIGLGNLRRADGYRVREIYRHPNEDAGTPPGLAWRAVEVVEAPVAAIPTERGLRRWLNYYGPPGQAITGVSYYQALDTNLTSPEMFKDKAVFIGAWTAVGYTGVAKDEFETPYGSAPGVFVHATGYLNLLRNESLVRLAPWAELLLVLGVGMLAGGGLPRLRVVAASTTALAGAAVVVVVNYWLFTRHNLWFNWVAVLLQISLAWVWSMFANSVREYFEKRLLQQSLALQLSPARVKQMMENPALRQPGGEEREVSILFSDIANFSSITEPMPANSIVNLLNKYFEVSLNCVHESEGTVVKLIGDAIFAIWNAPVDQPDHQRRACLAALKLREQLVKFNDQADALPLRTRIGLHTGKACVGNVGSTKRFDYTAIGENINLASRLEGLNKYLGTDVLLSSQTQEALEGSVVTRFAGRFKLKGFGRAVDVFELVGAPETAAATKPWREAFQQALHRLQRQEFDGAEAGFQRVLQLKPDDGPSKFYLGRIPEWRHAKLPDDWHATVSMDEK